MFIQSGKGCQSEAHFGKEMSCQQTSKDHLMSHLPVGKFSSPESLKQEVVSSEESNVYKTDFYPGVVMIVPQSPVKTEVGDTDIVKEEF